MKTLNAICIGAAAGSFSAARHLLVWVTLAVTVAAKSLGLASLQGQTDQSFKAES